MDRIPAYILLPVFLLSAAQARSQVLLGEGCPSCRIVMESLVVLGEGAGPEVVPYASVFLDVGPDGSYVMGSSMEPVLQIFDSAGTPRARFGRVGQGPGEFRMPLAASYRPDGGIDILDAAPRIVGFNPALEPDLHLIPDFFPGFGVMRIRGDSLLVAGYSTRGNLVGLSAHVFPPSGSRARSFGEVAGSIQSQDPHRLLRALAMSGDTAVWIATRDRYQIELWGLDGERRLSMTREVTWFEPIPRPQDGPRPPRGALGSMVEDPDGYLWVSFAVPREDWLSEAYRSDSSPTGWAVPAGARTRRVVEVLDPREGIVLARYEFPAGEAHLSGLFADARLTRGETDLETGIVTITVLRLRLLR